MGQIQSSVGLITGVPIEQMVNQLIQIAGRPRDLLTARNKDLQSQNVAVGALTALTLGVQFAAASLGEASTFEQRQATSSDTALLSVSVTGNPPLGNFALTPVRQATSQQLLSGGLASLDEPIGAGSLTFRFGGFLDDAIALDRLNGGEGISRGKIRVTDRSGASAVVDLRFAATVDDVLKAINTSEAVNVQATTHGDSIRLTDQTGGAGSLTVQEVDGGTTAADLGILLQTSSEVATGQDVLRLHNGLKLAALRGGNGLSLRDALADLEITFRDGSDALSIDLGDVSTLGELVDALNEADPARLSAAISSDGDRIELTDLTSDTGGTFSVSSASGGQLAEELGLTGAATGGLISGARLQAGLKTSLLSTLNGGQGYASLGLIELTDRSGATDSVDLAGSDTLDDVIEAINDASVGITARLNGSRNGIILQDTTGATANNLIIASGDGTNTAEALGIAVDVADASVNSGSLNLQIIGAGTKLASLNYGEGVGSGSFLITDSAGNSGAVNLTIAGATTVGDVINEINSLSIEVEARINDTGDGVLLVDQAGGTQTLTVTDVGNGRVAERLKLAGTAVEIDIEGTPTQAIDGSTAIELDIDEDDTLADLVEKINALGAGVTAGVISTGIGDNPHRLSLLSEIPGRAGALLVESSNDSLKFQEVVAAQDSLLLFGSPDSLGAGVLLASNSNTFEEVVPGLSATINGTSQQPVTVSVTGSDKSLVSGVTQLVSAYNRLRDKLTEATFFNATENTTGVLFGSNEALRVDSDLSRLFSGRIAGVGELQSLESVGIRLGENGKLTFDQEQLQAAFAENPQAVRDLFATKQLGFVARLDKVAEALAGEENSLLVNRSRTLNNKTESNADRIAFFNDRLSRQRERLLLEFFRLELTIGKMQSSIDSIGQIQAIAPLHVTPAS